MRVSQLSCAESGRGFGSSRDHDCKQNKIHDVTMYNDSSQSNALNTLDSEILRMRILKKRRILQENLASVEYSNNNARKFYIGRET